MDLPYFPSPYMLLCLFNSAGHVLNKLRETHSPLIMIYNRFSLFFTYVYDYVSGYVLLLCIWPGRS